jgi:hypothetical protein
MEVYGFRRCITNMSEKDRDLKIDIPTRETNQEGVRQKLIILTEGSSDTTGMN